MLWAFVYVRLKRSYAIDFSSLISSLYAVRVAIEETTYPVMDSPIHGEHNGASCNSVLHCICKVQPFL